MQDKYVLGSGLRDSARAGHARERMNGFISCKRGLRANVARVICNMRMASRQQVRWTQLPRCEGSG